MSAEVTGRRVLEPSRMRRAIARRMTDSKQQAPHFYVTADIDMEAALAVVAEANEANGPDQPVTLTAVLVSAVATVLEDEPDFNAHWTDEGHTLLDTVNVGVAIAVEDGLIAPAILECADLTLAEMAARLADLIARTRAGKLRGPELTAASFTVSNLGMFPVSSFVAILNPPQVGILSTGRSALRPQVVDGQIVARMTMSATLSADHRAVDGVAAARFLGRLKERLEGGGA